MENDIENQNINESKMDICSTINYIVLIICTIIFILISGFGFSYGLGLLSDIIFNDESCGGILKCIWLGLKTIVSVIICGVIGIVLINSFIFTIIRIVEFIQKSIYEN